MHVGLLGLGLCWVPVIAGILFLSKGYIGLGWGLTLIVPAPIVILVGGVIAWIAGNVCESPSIIEKNAHQIN